MGNLALRNTSTVYLKHTKMQALINLQVCNMGCIKVQKPLHGNDAEDTRAQHKSVMLLRAQADLQGVSGGGHEGEHGGTDGAPQEQALSALNTAQHALPPHTSESVI